MAQPVKIGDIEKPLAECTAADFDWLAQGAAPVTPASGKPMTTQSNCAVLAEEMRRGGAATFGDLGPARVQAGEQLLGLHYADTTNAILRAFGGGKKKADGPASE